MKTAISLPDDLFSSADAFAHRTGRSRSELYAEALREYLARYDEGRITKQLDELASELDTRLPLDQARATQGLLRSEPW